MCVSFDLPAVAWVRHIFDDAALMLFWVEWFSKSKRCKLELPSFSYCWWMWWWVELTGCFSLVGATDGQRRAKGLWVMSDSGELLNADTTRIGRVVWRTTSVGSRNFSARCLDTGFTGIQNQNGWLCVTRDKQWTLLLHDSETRNLLWQMALAILVFIFVQFQMKYELGTGTVYSGQESPTGSANFCRLTVRKSSAQTSGQRTTTGSRSLTSHNQSLGTGSRKREKDRDESAWCMMYVMFQRFHPFFFEFLFFFKLGSTFQYQYTVRQKSLDKPTNFYS